MKGTAKKESTLLPKNVLKQYTVSQETYQMVQTKYGPALFHETTKRFISVSPFLIWRKITMEALTDKDISFIVNLPQKLPNSDYELHLGRYGLYLTQDGKSFPLAKEQWEDAYQSHLDGSKVIIPQYKAFKRPSAK